MDDKFAVYVIVVEDTEANDMLIADMYPQSMERPAGNLSNEEAIEASQAAVEAAELFDNGIAR